MKLGQLKSLRERLMRPLFLLPFIFLVTMSGAGFQSPSPQDTSVIGRWQVNFTLTGGSTSKLEFNAQPKGNGYFRMAAVGADSDKQAVPATWSQTTNDRVNFSGEIELQFSPCCRETGTLIFKGKFKSVDTITGNAIFIGTTKNEENFNGYVSTAGTFTATRLPDVK